MRNRSRVRGKRLLLCAAALLSVWGQIVVAAEAVQRAQSRDRFAALDTVMQDAVAHGIIPGGVLVVGHNGRIVYRKAFGLRSEEPTREPTTTDTIGSIPHPSCAP